MKPTAIITSSWNAETKAHDPSMVIIFTPQRISAIGNPNTMSKDIADDILRKYHDIKPSEIEATLDFFLESYHGGQTSRAYGSDVEVVPYEGKTKAMVDRIRDGFLNLRVDAALES